MCETHNKEDYYTTCVCCREELALDFATLTNEGHVCEDCLDEFYAQCSDCRGMYHIDDLVDTYDGTVCDSCLENYYYCERCDTYYSDAYTSIHSVKAGDDCLQVCDNCLTDEDEDCD